MRNASNNLGLCCFIFPNLLYIHGNCSLYCMEFVDHRGQLLDDLYFFATLVIVWLVVSSATMQYLLTCISILHIFHNDWITSCTKISVFVFLHVYHTHWYVILLIFVVNYIIHWFKAMKLQTPSINIDCRHAKGTFIGICSSFLYFYELYRDVLSFISVISFIIIRISL